MGPLVAGKNDEEPFKNEGARVVTKLFIDFFRCSRAANAQVSDGISSKLLWLVFLPARMTKIHLKMKVLEWLQQFSHYRSMEIFPDAQEQPTHKSLVRSCRTSNPSKTLRLFLLPARIKRNQSKMKELEWSQVFPHFNPMGAIWCHGNQSSVSI